MQFEPKLDAGRIILISVALAVLLLSLDAWSHSLPTVVGIVAFALVVLVGLRRSEPPEELPVEPFEHDPLGLNWVSPQSNDGTDVRHTES